MKTFEEACRTSFMAVSDSDAPLPTPEEEREIMKALVERCERYKTLHHEIQSSELVMGLVCVLCEMWQRGVLGAEDLIKLAFSHGVVVGIEMEKRDDGVAL